MANSKMAGNIDIINPDIGFRGQKVATEEYLGRIMYEITQASKTRFENPTPFMELVQQMEIWLIGSDFLVDKYWEEKKKMTEEVNKDMDEKSKGYNSRIKNSQLNVKIEEEIFKKQQAYYLEWQKLLFKFAGNVSWQKFITETI